MRFIPGQDSLTPAETIKSSWHRTLEPVDPIQVRQFVETLIQSMLQQIERWSGIATGVPDRAETIAEMGRDGFVTVAPIPGDAELLVVGDIHGCYANFRAVLRQSDFVRRCEAGEQVYLVVVGDIFDRGNAAMHGILPLAIDLLARFPNRFFLIRGDHEYFVPDTQGQVVSTVRPARTIDFHRSLTMTVNGRKTNVFPPVFWEVLMHWTNALPELIVLSNGIAISHAGIPWIGSLSSAESLRDFIRPNGLSPADEAQQVHLNRLALKWTDPVKNDHVQPGTLDKPNLDLHSAFGRKDFDRFLQQTGITTLIRGHQHVDDGAQSGYDEQLITVFSSGGSSRETGRPNPQLDPMFKSFAEKTPRFLRIRADDISAEEIDWEPMLETINIGTKLKPVYYET